MPQKTAEIRKIAIANRGEVAVRIIRACQELGLQSVLLHSEADVQSEAYRLSDEKYCIGPAAVGQSYLDIENNVSGALASGAQAVHPGFGFLSENADFARRCQESGLVFIGPDPETIRKLGDKTEAKKLVEGIGGPLLPGYMGEDQSLEKLLKEAERIGYPVIAKVAAGGGGRGLKIIADKKSAEEQIQAAQREGLSAFGSDKVFLEKYLDRAKHIEVQIFGSASGKVYHLLDRECSVQRRHQKIVEEALSPSLTKELRERITRDAVRIAEAAGYRGAGTVEFLLQDQEYYFLEMNTRLQVEHPVTEEVLGIDLVKSQILTAQNQLLPWNQESVRASGHAIECRIYAEDAYSGGMPSTGVLGSCIWPAGPGRRFEVGFTAGDEITSFYDSMFAKVIVWDETRARAIQKMLRVLDDVIVFGVKTNIPFLKEILRHHEFVSGEMTTGFIEKYFPQGLPEQKIDEDLEKLARQLMTSSLGRPVVAENAGLSSPWNGYWRVK